MDRHSDRPGSRDPAGRRHCLVAECPCQDARIVSPRRAAFFAVWAETHGETANRSIEPDPEWRWTPAVPRTR